MRLLRMILSEMPEHLRMLAGMTVISAASITFLLGLVNQAARDASGGALSMALASRFLLVIALFAAAQHYSLVTASQDVERMLHRVRIRLFNEVRRADLVTVEQIGRAALHQTLIQETQTLAQTTPMLLIGAQQIAMLVFLAVYLAWLSPMACAMAFGFAAFTLALRFRRMVALGQSMQPAQEAELAVYDGLTDLVRGFKEARMSGVRAAELLGDLGALSTRARNVQSDVKKRWGREFALLQSLFYALIGMMVFVAPRFAKDYHQTVVEATIVTLFLVGPVGTLAYVTPLVSQTEQALANIDAMEARLRGSAARYPEESATGRERAPSTIALTRASFAYTDRSGAATFAVGPLEAEFRAGEITFITGGNGSGKSTMLRLLTGLMPLGGGCLLADGEPVAAERMQSYRDQISAVFSDKHLSRRLYGIEEGSELRANRLLERFEMRKKAAVRDGAFTNIDLSLGQRKRLALVTALVEDKRVIVLDEWAAGQDPHFRRVFYEEILPELKEQGKIVICVTHDDRWFSVAGRVLHMHEGRFAEVAS
jgi:putative pyoverdin transport system ATP-binding/permease protein